MLILIPSKILGIRNKTASILKHLVRPKHLNKQRKCGTKDGNSNPQATLQHLTIIANVTLSPTSDMRALSTIPTASLAMRPNEPAITPASAKKNKDKHSLIRMMHT